MIDRVDNRTKIDPLQTISVPALDLAISLRLRAGKLAGVERVDRDPIEDYIDDVSGITFQAVGSRLMVAINRGWNEDLITAVKSQLTQASDQMQTLRRPGEPQRNEDRIISQLLDRVNQPDSGQNARANESLAYGAQTSSGIGQRGIVFTGEIDGLF